MPRITIRKSTLEAVSAHAIGQMSIQGAVMHANGTVSIVVDDEVNDLLHARVDGITPSIDDVIMQLCMTGGLLDG